MTTTNPHRIVGPLFQIGEVVTSNAFPELGPLVVTEQTYIENTSARVDGFPNYYRVRACTPDGRSFAEASEKHFTPADMNGLDLADWQVEVTLAGQA